MQVYSIPEKSQESCFFREHHLRSTLHLETQQYPTKMDEQQFEELLEQAKRGEAPAVLAAVDDHEQRGPGLVIRASEVDGWTLLHRACQGGHIDLARDLLGRRADLYQLDNFGRTALDSYGDGKLLSFSAEEIELRALFASLQQNKEAQKRKWPETVRKDPGGGGKVEIDLATAYSESEEEEDDDDDDENTDMSFIRSLAKYQPHIALDEIVTKPSYPCTTPGCTKVS